MGAVGVQLAGTVTRPRTGDRFPAVLLITGSGQQDRDETLYGVPIFGQLAGRLAESGYLVIRFDKRGLGQSGGRPEHAGLEEYADDVASIVDWVRRRRDVDQNRIALVTYGVFSASGRIARVLGRTGINVMTRLMGLILAAMAQRLPLPRAASAGGRNGCTAILVTGWKISAGT